jgi:hypothetical protein
LGKELGVQIVSGVSSREHVHVLVEIPPQIAVSDVARRVKGRSSHRVRMEFQELRKRTWGRYFGRGAIFAPGAATSRTLAYFRILGSTNLRRRPVVVKFTNQKNPTIDGIELSGGSLSRTRTCDRSINSRLLYQLSYQGSRFFASAYSKPAPPLQSANSRGPACENTPCDKTLSFV